jgi:hypothetical protein
MKIFSLCLIFLISPIFIGQLFACRCFGESEVYNAFIGTDLIFKGKVISVKSTNRSKKYSEDSEVLAKNNIYKKKRKKPKKYWTSRKFRQQYKKLNIIKFRIVKHFKGKYVSRIVTIIVQNNSCGFGFQKDLEYIVYASHDKLNYYWTNTCSRTCASNVDEEKQLEYLKEITKSTYFEIFGPRHFLIGDFDGDLKQDTLKESFIDKETNKETFKFIGSLDTNSNVVDSIHKFEFDRNVESFLSFNQNKIDLDRNGLYFLSNIGDINNDGRDEIAVIKNHHLNYWSKKTCYFFTYKDNSWEIIYDFVSSRNILPTLDKLGNNIGHNDFLPYRLLDDLSVEVYTFENNEPITKKVILKK